MIFQLLDRKIDISNGKKQYLEIIKYYTEMADKAGIKHKDIAKLIKSTKDRRKQGRYIVEGIKMIKEALEIMKVARLNGTLIATNIIIDYVHDGKVYSNYDKEILEKDFDYYSWNPYFDGNWDIEKAKKRFKKYIG